MFEWVKLGEVGIKITKGLNLCLKGLSLRSLAKVMMGGGHKYQLMLSSSFVL